MTTLIDSEYPKLNLAYNITGISKNCEYFHCLGTESSTIEHARNNLDNLEVRL